MNKGRASKPKTLAEFIQARKRAGCRVCQLPIEVVAEIKTARDRKITRSVVLEWLQQERGIKITRADLDAHSNGRHENA